MKPNIKCDLWKLGFLSAERIDERDLDKSNLPEHVFRRGNDYYRTENGEIDLDELELFLKVKNAHNLNLLRLGVIAGAICLGVITVIVLLLWMRG